MKESMLKTATHYENLGREHAEQYTAFLTFIALDPADTFTTEELAETTKSLPPSGLAGVAAALTRALEGAGDQRSEYWQNRLVPYFHSIWPKSKEFISPAISEDLARLCVTAQAAFPKALEKLQDSLLPVEYPDFLISRLSNEDLCKQFPLAALTFLDAIIGQEARYLPEELRQCLNDIRQTNQQLATDARVTRLNELIERQGLD